MNRFDFLHAREPLRLPCIPVPWRGFSIVALACTAALSGVYRIESARLSAATALESAYNRRLSEMERVQRQHARAYGEVRALGDVLKSAADVAKSAHTQTRVITALSEALPPHVWFTSIRQDGNGLTVEGKASTLSGVAAFIRNLSVSSALSRPELASLTRADTAIAPEPMTYVVHVDVTA